MSVTAQHHPDPAGSPKRQQIVEAAAALFMVHGYGAVSTDAIARAAGVSKATLYAHFASKEQLFAEIIGDACQLGAFDFLPDQVDDIRAALTLIGQRIARFRLSEHAQAIYRVVIAESVRFPELGHAFYENGPRRFHRVFAGWVAAQTAAGRLTAADPDVAAEQYMALLSGLPFLRTVLGIEPGPTETEVDAMVAAATDTFLKAFGPPAT